jgi:hypothetical protein
MRQQVRRLHARDARAAADAKDTPVLNDEGAASNAPSARLGLEIVSETATPTKHVVYCDVMHARNIGKGSRCSVA